MIILLVIALEFIRRSGLALTQQTIPIRFLLDRIASYP